jgi:sugar O-acyltransferase (sialic acid O-acetyltransferase NeuD family)
VTAFAVDRTHITDPEFEGLPVLPFEDLAELRPPDTHDMFVAVSYRGINTVRAEICERAKAAGYKLISYLSSKATHWGDTAIGENCFIFEDNTLQPFVTIGDDVIMWSGNHIGHHATIEDHCFITSHVVVSGLVTVGAYTFIGVNATVRDGISIGRSNVIGSGSLIMKSTGDYELYVAPRTRPDERRSDEIGF